MSLSEIRMVAGSVKSKSTFGRIRSWRGMMAQPVVLGFVRVVDLESIVFCAGQYVLCGTL